MRRSILILLIGIYGGIPLCSQIVSIPDTYFLDALIEAGVDTNGDGLISYAEAEAVYSLNIQSEGGWGGSQGEIHSLEGIEAFRNLDTLDCSFHQLTSLDVSNSAALTYLYCEGNQLTSLYLSDNIALSDLNCSGNQLTGLDISNNAALTYLYCEGNQITSLDLSNSGALTYLYCDGNQLTGLDIFKQCCVNLFVLRWESIIQS